LIEIDPFRRSLLVLTKTLLYVASVSAASAATCEQMATRAPVAAINVDQGRAVKGYDVVAYFTDSKPVKGSPKFAVRWRGAVWQFASAEHRAAFRRMPGTYAPQYGGYCAFAESQRRIVDIDPRRWKTERGKLYLNANILAQSLWQVDPVGHIEKADTFWRTLPRREL
jgi:hypothetical protein